MMNPRIFCTVLCLGFLAACQSLPGEPGPGKEDGVVAVGCAECEVAKLGHGWCDQCEVGYVAGLRIESPLLYEAAHTHGHPMDPAEMQCESCRAAMAGDGRCEQCDIGWVDNEAHFTTLSYQVAKGRTRDIDELTCPRCHQNGHSFGWCEECARGMVGNVEILDRGDYEKSVEAFQKLLLARQEVDRCEVCAVAICNDGKCMRCNIEYRGGRPFLGDSP